MRLQRLVTVPRGYPLAILSVALVSATLLPFRSVLSAAQVMLLFMPLAAWIGRAAGVRPALAASTAALASVALLFVAPYGSVRGGSIVDQATMGVFVVAMVVVGSLAGSLRTRAGVAVQRQREIALLNHLSSRLVSEKSVEETATFIVNEVVAVLGAARAAVYICDPEGCSVLAAEAGETGSSVEERAVADEVARTGRPVGLHAGGRPDPRETTLAHSPDAPPLDMASSGAFVPLQSPDGPVGVLYARPLAGARELASRSRQLLAVADLAAAFLVRHRLEEAAALARATRESDRLKNTLVSSVSHELKTPLAAVTARVTGLLDEPAPLSDERVRSELTAVSDDLSRLDSSIRDLVDVSRLESDSWRPKLDVYDISEVLGTVASRVPVGQRSRVHFEVPTNLPPVRIDFAQIARAISNLVDNGLAYTPAHEPVTVGARVLGAEVIVWVEDRGPGVPEQEKEQVFKKFFRGTASGSSPTGTGLGLAIVREIVRSHGGRVWIEDAAPVGARFVISLPLEEDL